MTASATDLDPADLKSAERPAISEPSAAERRFTDAALERHKREGVTLAVRSRWVALAVIAVMMPFVDPRPQVLYYVALLGLFALVGWAQLRVARVGRSRTEAAVLVADLVLMTLALVIPNPFAVDQWPMAMEYRYGSFKYFYVLLAAAVLAYHWRTLMFMGVMTAGLWVVALTFIVLFAVEEPVLAEAAQAAFGHRGQLGVLLDPNNPLVFIRVQEVVVFLIVACTLAVSARRYNRLLHEHAGLERERANLARYFSPNVVEELSRNDEPLKQIRTQDVAVLFVDIVGFTGYAAGRSPEAVIETLREFHRRMEAAVFHHEGTLDKYLGDGLMATFGTPVAHANDAENALACARTMLQSVADWNAERAARGEEPIRASVGLHYGPAVLGDIGANRLEFAVIGNTVNVASRVESMTRTLSARLAVTDDLLRRAGGGLDRYATEFTRHDGLEVRGLDTRLTVWTLA